MAQETASANGVDNHGESSPLLNKNAEFDEKKKPMEVPVAGCTASGLPVGHGSVVGEPMRGRAQWNSGLFACLGRNDDFISSDLEVCVLGSVFPCVLHGSNVERLGNASATFASECVPYTVMCLIGISYFGWNVLAPCLSFPNRVAIRRKFNLEGNCEALDRLCGCCGSCVEDELQRERCELACDLATHVVCHPCALCQEGREIRRRVPHPGFHAQPVVVMIPPGEQSMGRVA